MSDFAGLIGDVARRLLSPPNDKLSTATELRYGTHGSLSVDLGKDVWHDHERGEGGGVLDLIERETGHCNGEAVAWLRDEGFVTDPRPNREPAKLNIAATYDYRDEGGELLFQVCRIENTGAPKTFRQRRPDGSGGWTWNTKGVRRVPYRLFELRAKVAYDFVYIVEGEKDVDRLAGLGLVATTNPGGAGKWLSEYNEHLRGADVRIVPDNDSVGKDHAAGVAAALYGVAGSVRIVELSGLGEKGDVSDWLDAGGSATRLCDLSNATPLYKPDTEAERQRELPYILMSEVDATFEGRWLIKGVVPATGIGAIFGPPGCGKTFVAIDLALSIALGKSWHGRKTEQAGVLYLAPDGSGSMMVRLAAYRKHHDVNEAPFALAPSPLDLLGHIRKGDVDRVLSLIAHIEKLHAFAIGAVFIDTVSRAMPGANENSPEDMTRFLENLATIAAGDKRLIVGIHHTPKADATVLRGHSALHGACDFELAVNGGVVTSVKQREAETGARFGFRLEVVELGFDADGDPINSCVAVPALALHTKQQRRLNERDKLALETLETLIAAEGEDLPAEPLYGCPFGDRNSNRGVKLLRFRDELHNRCDSVTKPDSFRTTFKRIRERLQDHGFIKTYDDWVWLP